MRILRLTFLAVSLCSASFLPAQTSSLGPWQVGGTVGVPFGRYGFSYRPTQVGWQVQGTLERRLLRYLDLGTSLAYVRTRESLTRPSLGLEDQATLARGIRTHANLMLGVSARANYRLGQGDLTFRFTTGLTYATGNEEVDYLSIGRRIRLRQVDFVDWFYRYEFGYTYWVNPRWGLSLTIGEQVLEYGTLYDGASDPNSSVRRWEYELPADESGTFVERADELRPDRFGLLQIGLVHRL